jgi:hypothetical protein
MHLNYTTYEYYQNLLVTMSMRFPAGQKKCPAKRHYPGRILSVSEEEIREVIGVAPTKRTSGTIKTEGDNKHSLVLVSVKKSRIGASRRSRHLSKQALRNM